MVSFSHASGASEQFFTRDSLQNWGRFTVGQRLLFQPKDIVERKISDLQESLQRNSEAPVVVEHGVNLALSKIRTEVIKDLERPENFWLHGHLYAQFMRDNVKTLYANATNVEKGQAVYYFLLLTDAQQGMEFANQLGISADKMRFIFVPVLLAYGHHLQLADSLAKGLDKPLAFDDFHKVASCLKNKCKARDTYRKFIQRFEPILEQNKSFINLEEFPKVLKPDFIMPGEQSLMAVLHLKFVNIEFLSISDKFHQYAFLQACIKLNELGYHGKPDVLGSIVLHWRKQEELNIVDVLKGDYPGGIVKLIRPLLEVEFPSARLTL